MKKTTKEKFIKRLEDLIDEGNGFFHYEQRTKSGRYSLDKGVKSHIISWQVRIKSSIKLIFGDTSTHYDYLVNEAPPNIVTGYELNIYMGLLDGALKDLNDGYIEGIELLLTSDLFDSIIQEARHLNEKNYKDPSAILGRVILEKSLKKLAAKNDINTDQKTTIINDQLKEKQIYNKPQWRLIQARLDIGNSAAHGEFEDYNNTDVGKMLDDIEYFIAQYLTSD